MKNKKFIAEIIPRKVWRKLDLRQRNTWIYIWFNCDAAGVYELDEDQFEFDNGYELDLSFLSQQLGNYLQLFGEKILIKSYLSVNYGKEMKPDYNPHKPAFRAISLHDLKINPSLNQACFKLVDVDEDEREEEDEIVSPKAVFDLIEKEDLKSKIKYDDHWSEYQLLIEQQFSYKNHYQRFSEAIETYGWDKIKKVIQLKVFEANSKDHNFQRKYLAPTTIFEPIKLEKYVNEVRDIEADRTDPHAATGKRNQKADNLKQASSELRRLKEMGV